MEAFYRVALRSVRLGRDAGDLEELVELFEYLGWIQISTSVGAYFFWQTVAGGPLENALGAVLGAVVSEGICVRVVRERVEDGEYELGALLR